MITKYNNYINEAKETFYSIIKIDIVDLLPENTNIELDSFSSGSSVSMRIKYRDIHNINRWYNVMLFSITKVWTIEFKHYLNRNDSSRHNIIKTPFEDIEELVLFLENYFISYYDKDIYENKNINKNNYIDILSVPVLNQDDYSNFIYKLINEDATRIQYIKYIEKYLNDDVKNKLQHFVDATKFDLI